MNFAGRTLVRGEGSGAVAAIPPLSFWGGYDPVTGLVIDRRHAAVGQSLAGKILVMPVGRGSSSASGAIAEAIRLGTCPSAIVLAEPDPIIVIGALVAETLYGRTVPIVVVSAEDHAALGLAATATVVGENGGARVSVP